MQLFPRSKPLSDRFGRGFFLSIPRAPGVYFMYDAADKLLYIGQSCDLRDRLNSYRHIHPDRDARRTWRLVHLVRRIEWRVTATADEAIALERELLLTHRPRFNRASVWPSPNWHIEISANDTTLSLRIFRESPEPTERESPLNLRNTASSAGKLPSLSLSDFNVVSTIPNGGEEFRAVPISPHRFGPFNSGLRYLFPTLLRLLFFSVAKPTTFSEVPLKLLKNRNLEHHDFTLPNDFTITILTNRLHKFLALESDDLIRQLETEIQSTSTLSQFEKTYWAAELETLQDFFDARTDCQGI